MINSILLLSILLYIILINVFIIGLIKLFALINDKNTFNLPFLSVIIAVKNEEKNIINLLSDLSKQNYPKDLFEVIVVNDHSTDKTIDLLYNNIYDLKNLKIVNSEEEGKHAAINEGIKIALSDYIITTDGDCRVGKNWLNSYANLIVNEKPDLIIAPVNISKKNGLFSNFEIIEFISLAATTAGSEGIGMPIMANGANMMYKKDLWNTYNEKYRNIKAGDDVFLLHYTKSLNKKIIYLNNPDAVVFTYPCNSIIDYINQRIRWTSKTKNYSDIFTLYTAIVTLLANISVLFMIFRIIFLKINFIMPISVIMIKIFSEFILMWLYVNFFYKSYKKSFILYFIPSQLIYPIYLILLFLGNIFIKKRWKSKKI